jgi:CheY-like chemotaxis protein
MKIEVRCPDCNSAWQVNRSATGEMLCPSCMTRIPLGGSPDDRTARGTAAEVDAAPAGSASPGGAAGSDDAVSAAPDTSPPTGSTAPADLAWSDRQPTARDIPPARPGSGLPGGSPQSAPLEAALPEVTPLEDVLPEDAPPEAAPPEDVLPEDAPPEVTPPEDAPPAKALPEIAPPEVPAAASVPAADWIKEQVVCPRCNLHFRPPQRGEDRSARRKTILVVDDLAYFRQIAKDALQPTFDVKTAATGAEARDTMARGGIDLLVLDLTLDGCNAGRDLLAGLQPKPCPILIFTAQDESEMYGENWDSLKRLGADDLVIKGMKVAESLLRKASTLLDIPVNDD